MSVHGLAIRWSLLHISFNYGEIDDVEPRTVSNTYCHRAVRSFLQFPVLPYLSGYQTDSFTSALILGDRPSTMMSMNPLATFRNPCLPVD